MAPADLPTFPTLTPDDRIWRVDWFGQVAYPGAVRQYRQPCIKVAISPWLDAPDSSASSGDFHTDIAEQRHVWIPLGALSMVRIGDLWQDGRCMHVPLYSNECFQLEITPGTTSFVKAGLAIDDHYLLPFSEHPWHRAHTQSFCLTITSDDDRTILIPGTELIRFYFGTSSSLINRLVTGPFNEATLWQKKHHDPATGHLHLKLAQGLHSTSAYDVGRIALDSIAQRAASGIYNHIVKATTQGDSAYLYTTFPFWGKTTLIASGIWLSFGGHPERTYVVFRLHSCSSPFPFSSLSIDRVDKKVKKKVAGSDLATQDKRVLSTTGNGGRIEPGDPGGHKGPRHLSIGHSIRFPDLARKPFWSERAETLHPAGVLRRRADGALEALAFGEPEGAGNARAICVGPGEPETKVAVNTNAQQLPRFVRVGMETAVSQYSDSISRVFAKPLLPFGCAVPAFMLPLVVDSDGVVDMSVMHTGLDGEQRTRRACFVGLFDNDREIKKVAVVEGDRRQSAPTIVDVANTDRVQLLERILGRLPN